MATEGLSGVPTTRRRSRKPAHLPPVVIYQIKVTLRYVKPPVWRRLLVPSHATLRDLHYVLQAAFGWEECHLHEFVVGDRRFEAPWEESDPDAEDEGDVRLCELAPKPGPWMLYVYDFGDDWEHAIQLEKILDPDPTLAYPICLKGARPAPPEDSGGPGGYVDKLEILADPGHEYYAEIREWMGAWDAERFSVLETNQALRRTFPSPLH